VRLIKQDICGRGDDDTRGISRLYFMIHARKIDCGCNVEPSEKFRAKTYDIRI